MEACIVACLAVWTVACVAVEGLGGWMRTCTDTDAGMRTVTREAVHAGRGETP